jgi:hypothetical protein
LENALTGIPLGSYVGDGHRVQPAALWIATIAALGKQVISVHKRLVDCKPCLLSLARRERQPRDKRVERHGGLR